MAGGLENARKALIQLHLSDNNESHEKIFSISDPIIVSESMIEAQMYELVRVNHGELIDDII